MYTLAATNPHPNPTDFKNKIRIRRIPILAGSVTSLVAAYVECPPSVTDGLTPVWVVLWVGGPTHGWSCWLVGGPVGGWSEKEQCLQVEWRTSATKSTATSDSCECFQTAHHHPNNNNNKTSECLKH